MPANVLALGDRGVLAFDVRRTPTRTITIRCTEQLIAALDQAAQKRGSSREYFVREALREKLLAQGAKDVPGFTHGNSSYRSEAWGDARRRSKGKRA